VVFVGGGEREDRTAVPCAYFDDTAVAFVTLNLPVIGIGKRVEGGNDNTVWNRPAVLLTDDIVELAVSNEIHAPVSVRVGSGSSDERDRATPRLRMFGEVKAVCQDEAARIAGRGFVAATYRFFRRSLRLASLNIAIEPASKQIGAVHGVPDKAVVGSRSFVVRHCPAF